jgi:hypothetical protein
MVQIASFPIICHSSTIPAATLAALFPSSPARKGGVATLLLSSDLDLMLPHPLLLPRNKGCRLLSVGDVDMQIIVYS